MLLCVQHHHYQHKNLSVLVTSKLKTLTVIMYGNFRKKCSGWGPDWLADLCLQLDWGPDIEMPFTKYCTWLKCSEIILTKKTWKYSKVNVYNKSGWCSLLSDFMCNLPKVCITEDHLCLFETSKPFTYCEESGVANHKVATGLSVISVSLWWMSLF